MKTVIFLLQTQDILAYFELSINPRKFPRRTSQVLMKAQKKNILYEEKLYAPPGFPRH